MKKQANNIKMETQLIIGFGIILTILVIETADGLYQSLQGNRFGINEVLLLAGLVIAIYTTFTTTRRIRVENITMQRNQRALDAVTSNVMVANHENVITYMNESVMSMMRIAEDDIRKELKNFDTNHLIGTSIDNFHKNPAHQQSMLKALKSTYRTQIKVGGRSFNLIANPIIDDAGKRLGTVVEWLDVTAELAIQDEINDVVEAVANGDFTQRVPEDNKEGFQKALAEGINRISETSHTGLSEAVDIIQALSEGDLTKQIMGDYKGTFDEIKQAVNRTVTQLADMVQKIKDASNTVNSASSEISSGSADLSQRTEQQASTLEQTAASMEEITGTVRQNSENATNANSRTNEAAKVAEEGGNVVSRAVSAMSSIESSSKKVVDIISVIDEIAFQTNLLALNAAVEAARAGEAGKGFAVVAAEVRKLAGRSAEASKDIKTLINESVEQVNSGSELVNKAGKTLEEIVTSVREVADLIAEINNASVEQTSAIEEINTAVSQMDEATQQNAALVEENTAAAQSLVEQSQDLEELVSFFRLDENAGNVLRISDRRKAANNSDMPAGASRPAAPKKLASSGGAPAYDEGWEEF